MGTLLECRWGVLVGSGKPISLIRPNVVGGLAALTKQLLMSQTKLKELEAKLDRQADGIRALMKAQGLTVESAPLLAEDV